MLRTYDRIYGRLDLPERVVELATTCPLILRLREVRQANIPFRNYPSFANVDRYEHSLGVAHLTWRWAQNNSLEAELAEALTIAALYHDAATPAFGHLFEEFLAKVDFDHEEELINLLRGTSSLPGRDSAQVFLGMPCKLREVLPKSADTNSPLSINRIALLLSGRDHTGLGAMLKGAIDLDNIDNVLRAGSAMGLFQLHETVHPYSVADALAFEEGRVAVVDSRAEAVIAWAKARHTLYDAILTDSFEFRCQTAIRWAIDIWTSTDTTRFGPDAWKLTEPQLIYEHLNRVKRAKFLMDRFRLAAPPQMLISGWIEDSTVLAGQAGSDRLAKLNSKLEELSNLHVYTNFYLDKRYRTVKFPVSSRPSTASRFLTISSPLASTAVRAFVGTIYTSKVGTRSNLSRSESVARKKFDSEDLRRAVEEVLGQPFAMRKSGPVEPDQQQSLFSEAPDPVVTISP